MAPYACHHVVRHVPSVLLSWFLVSFEVYGYSDTSMLSIVSCMMFTLNAFDVLSGITLTYQTDTPSLSDAYPYWL